jgi:hypothetical protein
MSDRFDDLLFGAVDSATQAAHASGAAAARKRGKRRRNHQILAASALSLALLVGVSGIASASLGGSNREATASTTLAVPPSRTASPGTGASLSPAGGASSSVTIPASTSPLSSATAATPQWLAAADVPFAQAMRWTAEQSQTLSGSAAQNLLTVPYPCVTGDVQSGGFETVVVDAQSLRIRQFVSQGVALGNGAWAAPTAFQAYYSYANDAAALSAFQRIGDDISVCSSPDAGTTQNTKRILVKTAYFTASTRTSFSYILRLRDSQDVPAEVDGNYAAASDYHAYVAIQGDVLEIVEVQGAPAISSPPNDPAILAYIAGLLG